MSLIGTKIGSIRILSLLGQGGMGAVYAGFDEKLRREVAVKVIRSDRLSPLSRTRLLREARALSQLNHPNICGIFDYIEGTDNDVLILERLYGRSLRQVLEEGPPLSFTEKLRIAEQIAAALEAAHAKGIVHRDLKMSNLMLTDGLTVKVLDFGLASSAMGLLTPTEPLRVSRRAEETTPHWDDRAGLPSADPGHQEELPWPDEPALWKPKAVQPTEMGKVLGTATCMSPEQIRGEPLTVASDQYSFGLLLQELFTGKPGYAIEGQTELLLKKVREGKTLPVRGVPRPLAILIESLKAPVPQDRPSAAETLSRLGWIRALPARRVRRLAAAAVALALAGGAVMYTIGLRQERDTAIEARNEAEQFRQEAGQVSEFLANLFRVADPGEDRGNSITVREVLDRGAEQVRSELHGQPLSRARLLDAIGRTYFSLGLYPRARLLLEEAVALRRIHLDAGHPDLALSLRNLATVRQAQGEGEEAEPLFLAALAIQEKALAPSDPELANDRALVIWRKSLGPDHPRIGLVLANLASDCEKSGQLDEAERFYRQALELRFRVLGPDHPDFLRSRQGFVTFLETQGRYAEATALKSRRAAAPPG